VEPDGEATITPSPAMLADARRSPRGSMAISISIMRNGSPAVMTASFMPTASKAGSGDVSSASQPMNASPLR